MKSRHVTVAGSAVRVYCSEACKRDAGIVRPVTIELAPRPRRRWPHLIGFVVAVGVPTWLVLGRDSAVEPRQPAAAAATAPGTPDTAAAPAVDPAEAAFVADIMKDAWFHPIAGPTRRMPRNHAQAFGADRPGDRPAECGSGHCGADVGGNLWGEPIRAAHDGVVDRVNRGPNEASGGIYVRISHRDGTVFTQYFHLAAVPRWITPGTVVEAGQVIGLLGDTGVKESAPHLHFAISVKPTATTRERYLDPEPLLSIWPLWVDDGTGAHRMVTHAPPGLPARARGYSKKSPARAAKPAPRLGSAPVSDPSQLELGPAP